MPHHEQSAHAQGPQHSVSYVSYVIIWFGLVALTALTVALAGIELGRWVIITALVIAAIKSLLVLNIFMHLRFEDRIFRLFTTVAFVTFLIFIVMTFFDYAFH
jgi:cytochrome c oxidase subunit IV